MTGDLMRCSSCDVMIYVPAEAASFSPPTEGGYARLTRNCRCPSLHCGGAMSAVAEDAGPGFDARL